MKRHEALIAKAKNLEADPSCRYCEEEGEEESSQHIMGECPAFCMKRYDLIGDITYQPPFAPRTFTPTRILEFLKEAEIMTFKELLVD